MAEGQQGASADRNDNFIGPGQPLISGALDLDESPGLPDRPLPPASTAAVSPARLWDYGVGRILLIVESDYGLVSGQQCAVGQLDHGQSLPSRWSDSGSASLPRRLTWSLGWLVTSRVRKSRSVSL